jgi:ABC-2 type transport system permease protein
VSALLRAEFRKLVTTRSALWLLLGAVGLAIAAVTVVSGQEPEELRRPLVEHQFWFLQTFVKLFMVVLGIRMITDEFRFGTIVPTVVSSRDRLRVLGAKTILAAGVGLVTGLITQAVLLGSVKVFLSWKGVELTLGDRGVPAILGSAGVLIIWAVMGVAVGSFVRNQVGAIVGAFVWLMALEDVVRTQVGDLGGYLPGQAGLSLALSTTDRTAVIGGLVLLGWTAAMWVAGAFVMKTRDI